MGMIPPRDARLIAEHFAAKLTGPVSIDFFTQSRLLRSQAHTRCAFCDDTEELLRELTGLTDRISLRVHEFAEGEGPVQDFGITRIPAFVLKGTGRGRVRYVGIPSGYEFAALVEDLVDVSRGSTDLPEHVKEELARVRHQVHIQVFGTPACPHCPRASRTAHKLAIECQNVTADAIEVGEFPDLAHRYAITSVPKIVINETIEFFGVQPVGVYLDAIRSSALV